MVDKKLNIFLVALQGLCVAGIALLLVALTLDALEGPVAVYRSATVLTPHVRPGQAFEARVEYEKFRDCGGTAIVSFTSDRTGESHVIATLPLGDRPPGTWTRIRRYIVPPEAAPGSARFTETLSYVCPSGASVVRSPTMPFTVDVP